MPEVLGETAPDAVAQVWESAKAMGFAIEALEFEHACVWREGGRAGRTVKPEGTVVQKKCPRKRPSQIKGKSKQASNNISKKKKKKEKNDDDKKKNDDDKKKKKKKNGYFVYVLGWWC